MGTEATKTEKDALWMIVERSRPMQKMHLDRMGASQLKGFPRLVPASHVVPISRLSP